MKKILFVTCVNNGSLYKRSLEYIKKLEVPPSISVDFFPIYEAESMTSGYNQALDYDAKYKVYLHQDVFILYEQFLVDILALFNQYSDLGMIGMAGCRKLPADGVWWEGEGLVGKVLMERLYHFGEADQDVAFVEAIDGLLMATQYDIPWREDLFQGFHYYDVSQSMEFQKKEYKVGVPKQKQPWCYHLDDDVNSSINTIEYQRCKKIYAHHYV